jgi:hypothetical protein
MPGIHPLEDWIESNLKTILNHCSRTSGDAIFASGEVRKA